MAIQARGQASRLAILVAAAEVFDETGFTNTSLVDVITRAAVSNGRFAYHFPTKESLASALIETADKAIADTMERILTTSASTALEGLIRASFAVADLALSDPVVRVGLQLRHGLGQLSSADAAGMATQRTLVNDAIAAAVAEGDLRGDFTPEQLGHALLSAMVGNHLQSPPAGATVSSGLAVCWQVLLRGVVTEQSAGYFEQFVSRLGKVKARA
ncbi:MAG: TetR family transcriptional regulator [Mycobacterium sp.]